MRSPAALRVFEPRQIRKEAALRIPLRCRGLPSRSGYLLPPRVVRTLASGNHLERDFLGRGRSGRPCPAWRNHVGEPRILGTGRCVFAVRRQSSASRGLWASAGSSSCEPPQWRAHLSRRRCLRRSSFEPRPLASAQGRLTVLSLSSADGRSRPGRALPRTRRSGARGYLPAWLWRSCTGSRSGSGCSAFRTSPAPSARRRAPR
jgi:hypothetical protein